MSARLRQAAFGRCDFDGRDSFERRGLVGRTLADLIATAVAATIDVWL